MFQKVIHVFLFSILFSSLLSAQFNTETVVSRDLENFQQNSVADLNNDGHLDAIASGIGGIIWYAGDGNGDFGLQRMIFYTAALMDYTTGDFDGDGDVDVVLYDVSNNKILLLKNDGIGNFRGRTVVSEIVLTPRRLSAGDMDNDGDIDFFLTTFSNEVFDEILYFENQGAGIFAAPTVIFESENTFGSIAIADLNADGFLDIIGTSYNDIFGFIGDGTGNFATTVIREDGPIYYALDLEDVDSDGDLDVVTGAGSRFYVYANDGVGTFSETEYGQGMTGLNSVRGVFAEDINGDGYSELFYVTSLADETGYLLSNSSGEYDTKVVLDYDADEGKDILLADFNEDGILDLYYLCYKGMRIAQGNAETGFAPEYNILTDDPNLVEGVEGMDVDNDGDLDVLVAYRDYTSQTGKKLMWFENIENEFRVQHFIDATSDGVEQMRIADFNGDDFLDIVVTTDQSTLLQLYQNQGDGTFAAPVTIGESSNKALHVADFNNDNFPDIVHTASGSSSIYLRLNDGTGGFAEPVLVASTFNFVVHLNAADLNGDGHQDLVYTDYSNDEVGYFAGSSTANFSNQTIISDVLDSPLDTQIGRLNTDNTPDVVIASSQDDRLLAYQNMSNGSVFVEMPLISDREFPSVVRLADFDVDGDLDVLCSYQSDAITWFENNGNAIFIGEEVISPSNSSNTIAVADIDGNGGMDAIVGYNYFVECKTGVFFNENFQNPSLTSSITSVSCADNDTPFDLTDDIIQFSITAESVLLGSTYVVSAFEQDVMPNTAVYGQSTDFSLLAGSAGGGDVQITITDIDNPTYENVLLLNDPGVCSVNPSIEATLITVTCLDNDTSTDPSDDVIAFTLQANGTGTGDTYLLQTQDYTIFPATGNYGMPLEFMVEPGSAGGGDITLSVTDEENSETVTELILSDPGTCSLVYTKDISQSDFRIFPNPTAGEFYLETKNSSPYLLTVYNNAQQLMLQKKLSERKVYLDFSEFASGIYTLSMQDVEGKVFFQKIAIVKN